jgi:hypothetical protein
MAPRSARPGSDARERLGRYRGIVERAVVWLHRNRRWLVSDERDDALHDAFPPPRLRAHLLAVAPAKAVITFRHS